MKCEGLQFVVKKKLNEGKIPLQICQDQSGTVGLRTIERDGPAAAGRGADPAPCPSWEDEVRENARRAIFNKAKPERKTARVHPEVGSAPRDFTEQHPASFLKGLGAVSLQEKENPAPF